MNEQVCGPRWICVDVECVISGSKFTGIVLYLNDLLVNSRGLTVIFPEGTRWCQIRSDFIFTISVRGHFALNLSGMEYMEPMVEWIFGRSRRNSILDFGVSFH